MNCTAAEVIAAALVLAGRVTRPASAGSWPITVGSMPDDMPDNRVSVYDITPEIQGKLYDTGESVERPMVQIRVRAKAYRDGQVKIKALTDALSAETMRDLTVNSVAVRLVAVTVNQAGGFIGQEEKNTRQLFTAVVKAAITER